MIEQYTKHLENPGERREKAKQLHSQYLDAFYMAVNIVTVQYKDRLGEFLSFLGNIQLLSFQLYQSI